MTDPKIFLIKSKPLEAITAHCLMDGVIAHMSRAANQILTNKVAHPAGTDPDFNQLAINLHRLANEIDTFLKKKGNIAGEKTP